MPKRKRQQVHPVRRQHTPMPLVPRTDGKPSLDANAFPHLMDLIVSYAPRHALLALRGTSKTYCDSAHKLIFRHVVVTHSDKGNWQEWQHGILKVVAPGGSRLPGLQSVVRDGVWVKRLQTYTVIADLLEYQYYSDWLTAGLKNVPLTRRHHIVLPNFYDLHFRPFSRETHPPDAKVSLEFVTLTNQYGWSNAPRQRVWPDQGFTHFSSARTNVVTIRYDPRHPRIGLCEYHLQMSFRSSRNLWYTHSRVKHVVVIFMPTEQGDGPPAYVPEGACQDDRRGIDGVTCDYGFLQPLLSWLVYFVEYTRGLTLDLVGVTEIQRESMNLPRDTTAAEIRRIVLDSVLAAHHTRHLGTGDRYLLDVDWDFAQNQPQATGTLRFYTLDEYRHKLGHDRFTLYTQDPSSRSPNPATVTVVDDRGLVVTSLSADEYATLRVINPNVPVMVTTRGSQEYQCTTKHHLAQVEQAQYCAANGLDPRVARRTGRVHKRRKIVGQNSKRQSCPGELTVSSYIVTTCHD